MMLELTDVARPFLSIPVVGLVIAVTVILARRFVGAHKGDPSGSS
jgi:hypothetical protein